MNVVFDTGVWISALVYEGPPLEAILAVLSGPHRLVLSDAIHAELLRVLASKFRWSNEDAEVTLQPYLSHALRLQVRGEVRGACRDPSDDVILETALLSSADRLVTGDKDLLTLGTFHQTRIVTVRAFLDEFSTA